MRGRKLKIENLFPFLRGGGIYFLLPLLKSVNFLHSSQTKRREALHSLTWINLQSTTLRPLSRETLMSRQRTSNQKSRILELSSGTIQTINQENSSLFLFLVRIKSISRHWSIMTIVCMLRKHVTYVRPTFIHRPNVA